MGFDNYQLRLIEKSDAENYYKYAFEGSCTEAKYFTGTVANYSQEQVLSYVDRIVNSENRYDFLILRGSEIVGEVVLSEIEEGNCHYRICIYKKENFSKGIGFNASKEIFRFAFDDLNLSSIELEVFPFNERGIALYKKMGFEIVEDIVDDEADDLYKKIYLMRLIKDSYNSL